MTPRPVLDTLRIGLVGSGFIARFHLQSMLGVRNVRVGGVYSTTPVNRERLAERANALALGPCRAFDSLAAMIASGEVDALWILTPNNTRLDTMREIHRIATADRTRHVTDTSLSVGVALGGPRIIK